MLLACVKLPAMQLLPIFVGDSCTSANAVAVYLQDAISLHHRPFLHTTTWPLALLVLWYYCRESLYLPMLLVAILSHHLRDAVRRGLWFWPVGSTPPVPWLVACALIVVLAIAGRLLGVPRLTEPSRTELTLSL